MKNLKPILLSAFFVATIGIASGYTHKAYAEDDEGQTEPFEPEPRSWACRNLGGIWCWF